MTTINIIGAGAPGTAADTRKDEAPAGCTAQGFRGQTQNASLDSHGVPRAAQALRVIEGEGRAATYLARLRDQQTDPDELALIVSTLTGANLAGFCRVIAKSLGGAR